MIRMKKIIIYQILPRLFGNRTSTPLPNGTIIENGCGKFNDFDIKALRRIKSLGCTHVWFTGVIRHATKTDYTAYGIPKQTEQVVKGNAGSPYAIADYYDVDPDLAVDVDGRMDEWEALVSRVHKCGLSVVLDFVPNHVAREYKSVCRPKGVADLGENDDKNLHFSTLNNFYYCWGQPFDTGSLPHDCGKEYVESPARATGNDCFSNRPGMNDWYETVKLNYGIDYCDAGGRSEHFSPVPDTWKKMTDILLFWASKGIDAFRCDMAEMVPSAFWSWATARVREKYPEVKFIGEVYNPSLYREYISSGFDYLYDKVGMYDCIRDVICGNRKPKDITVHWQSTDDIKTHMLYFLENHDEQRVASRFFAGNGLKGLPGLVVSAFMNSSPFMLYAGQEYGEEAKEAEGFSGLDGRTTIFDYWSVESLRKGYYDRKKLSVGQKELENAYSVVLNLANNEAAIREGDFYDLMYVNGSVGDDVFAFLRKKDKELILVVANFSDRMDMFNIVIPSHAFDWLGIPEGEYNAEELISKGYARLTLRKDYSVEVVLDAHEACAYKIVVK